MRRIAALLAFLCAFFSSSIAIAQVTTEAQPTLIGGTVADPRDYPASPFTGTCSSSISGPRVQLIAAHCIASSPVTQFTIGTTRYSAACTPHPLYRTNGSADWALCQVTTDVTGVPYESIATPEEAACAVGKRYLWTGYGCTVWGGQLDGRFRFGRASTTICPASTNQRGYEHYIRTRDNVALCSGDSGGAGFVELADGSRRIVGVNSASDTRVESFVSNTYLPEFRNWARSWADQRGLKICGIHDDATGCRGTKDPEPEPEPDCSFELGQVEGAVSALKACLTR